MKKLLLKIFSYFFVLAVIIIFLKCSNPEEPDTTPPTVTITSPQNNSVVSEIAIITCVATDNEGVEKVELWVDGVSTDRFDNAEPYSLEWNTTTFSDNSAHTITVRAHDINGNKTDSNPITLVVNNSNSFPTKINILSITYNLSEMTVIWEKSNNSDFSSYELLQSDSENGTKTSLVRKTDRGDTSYVITTFDPTHENWFWIMVEDSLGFSTLSDGYKVLDSTPNQSDLNPIIFRNNSFLISWSRNNDEDFNSYMLFESLFPDMSNEIEIYMSNDKDDTTFVVSGISQNELRYYRMLITDYWGLNTASIVRTGSSYPKIGFLSGRDGGSEIYLMDIFGNDPTKLTHSTGTILDFQFTPDGSKIAFISNIGNNREVFLIDVYGNNPINLTNSQVFEENLQISQDGSKILFQYYVDGNRGYDIYIMDTDGTNLIELTNTLNNDENPKFSPDGSKIVFESGRDNDTEVYIMNIDGSNQIRLTNRSGYDGKPVFSSDGSKIAFVSNDGSGVDIFLMNTDGTNQINLTNLSTTDENPQFSPDGSKIAFQSERDGDWEIYIMNIEGSNQIKLTNSAGLDLNPQFSEDGANIVFQTTRDGDWEVYIMDVNGGDQVSLTNMPQTADFLPKFQPIN